MRTRRLGSSDLEVTVVGLGCNNFGGRIDEAAAREVIDAALDAGVTFFDTADVYGNRGGSEEIIGRALGGRRDQVVLATKFGHDLGDGETARGARPYIRKAVEASLRRLQTDRIDLYQYHRPDGVTPLEETLEALHELVQEGTVRAIGSSNFTPAMVEEAAAIAAERGLTPFVSEQSEYSWLRRGAEDGLLPDLRAARRRLHSLLPARERAADGQVREGRAGAARAPACTAASSQDDDLDAVERLRAFGERHGASLLEVAIGGLAAVAGVASVIAGATKPEQVRANAAAGAWEPSPDALAELRSL